MKMDVGVGWCAPLDEGKVFKIVENVVEPIIDFEERLHFQELRDEVENLATKLEILEAHVNTLGVSHCTFLFFFIFVIALVFRT